MGEYGSRDVVYELLFGAGFPDCIWINMYILDLFARVDEDLLAPDRKVETGMTHADVTLSEGRKIR
jgi:hypothetical protein